MAIEQSIIEWDGKTVDDIKSIYDLHHTQSDFAQQLIALLQRTDTEQGASWLIKAYLEDGGRFDCSEVDVLISSLNNSAKQSQHWQTKLHILQGLPYLTFTSEQAEILYLGLRKSLSDPNKFVRAWTYNGFYQLSLQYDKYVEETKQFFAMAQQDEAPSVKARLRNIMKTGFFD